jgi:type I restriction enzyme, R subunit
MDIFRFDEKYLSQIPALQMLVNLGYVYLTPAEAMSARGGKAGNVLLEEILREQLKKLSRIQHKGGTYLFSEENIQSAIQRLKNVKYDGLLKTNEAVYDLLTLGVALEQSIEGDQKSFTVNYVDWRNPENNVYHVAVEFAVERTRSVETCAARHRAVRQRHSLRGHRVQIAEGRGGPGNFADHPQPAR